jgi:hypothetical protein
MAIEPAGSVFPRFDQITSFGAIGERLGPTLDSWHLSVKTAGNLPFCPGIER